MLCILQARTQQPWELLDQWGRKRPVQKLYLHFDRENYIAGETAWFKAYLVSDYMPDTISSTVYVELVGQNNQVLNRKVLPVLLGASSGQIELPDSLRTGTYTFRAYTRTMYELSRDFVFKKGVFVFGKSGTAPLLAAPAATRLNFFPEGGNLVAGLSSNVAFRATDAEGNPMQLEGSIRNSKGEELTRFSTYHDGMGIFELTPATGENYYAETKAGKFPLPETVSKGITVNIMPHEQGLFYEVQQNRDDPDFTAAYLVGQMQHRVVFRKELNTGAATSFQGVVNTLQLRSGIIQITFFNRKGMPLAERLWFNNNREYVQAGEIIADTVDTRPRARNRFRIALKDTVEGNFSVSVVDADYETSLHRQENIITSLLLTADLQGYVHNPHYYFSANNDSVKTATDLLMMTHGWRRFKWTELPVRLTEKTTDQAFITISGRAVLRGTNRAFDDKDLLLLINNAPGQKKRSSYFLKTDKDGQFLIDSLLFFDKHLLIFSDVRGKKSLVLDIKMRGDTLHRPYEWTGFSTAPAQPYAGISRWQMDYDAILKENGQMLEGITVKVQKKSPLQEVEEKYTSNLFMGDAVRSIDLVNSDEALNYGNIFDYLQTRVNGLVIAGEGADYVAYFRQQQSMSSMGNIPMTIYLDEIETDANVVATVPAGQIALVKVYSNFVGAVGNAPGGVLAIYTKKGEDYGKSGSFNNVVVYNGYSVVKEFFAPDYKTSGPKDRADNRITLEWRPSVFINSINPKIALGFYNNDRTRRYKIIVEGMTSTGKYIWLEKMAGAQ